MAPPVKRKRPDRGPYNPPDTNDAGRPSPHRPQNLNLAQQNQYGNGGRGGRGGRRDSRGGGRRGERETGSPATGSNAHSPVSRASPSVSSRPDNPPSPSATMAPPPSAPVVHARPATPQERPAPPPPAPAPATKPAFKFTYAYVTDEHKAAWKTSGRKAILDAAVDAQEKGDILALSIIYQELVRAGLDSRIDAVDAGQVVKDVLAEAGNGATESASLFLDTLAILTETESTTHALRAIIVATGISPMQMREELDVPLLTALGMIRSTFFKMGTRHATNQLYRQSNYNLLREETEGYSKLMTEYFTTTHSEPPTGETAADTFQRVKALIGAFDLDVGRALDVTLDVFANLMIKHYRFFIKFMRVSSWWPEEKGFEKLKWETLGIETLPRWAQPGVHEWTSSDEEREHSLALREERDQRFWKRVREVGLEAFFELGGRRITEGEIILEDGATNTETKQKKPEEKTEAEFNKEWMATTKTLPPPGNRVAAQLLGFKLRFYASSARDPHDSLPDNLIYLAALLIKIGFISLRDLYPHLYPLDKDMDQVREKLMKEKAERERKNRPGGGQPNALAMAAALSDDTIPAPTAATRLREAETSRAGSAKPEEKSTTPKPEEEKEEKLPEPADQKIALLKSLLCIGAIPESLYILGKFPWLPDVHPDLPEYIHRILHHSISKVYEALRPIQERESVRLVKKLVTEKGGAEKGELKYADPNPRKTLRWAQLDRVACNPNDKEEIEYRFYWEDWIDNVPICQSVDDIFLLCSSFLNFSGAKIGQDSALLSKLARIGKWSLTNDKSDSNFSRWIDLSKRLLVPALSLTKANPGVVNEVFELLKLFSTATRYSIYAEWYMGTTSRNPDIVSAFNQSTAETKDVLKRISKTNTKQMARALAKVAYSSPGIVFKVALNQIESYDNLVEVIVECARYFTFLGYDVLTWSLMSSLGGKGRDRVQADGMLTSRWLQALSLFAGRVFKRYSVMNPTPVLQYVTHQLRAGNSTDLEVLEQILTQMGGIPADPVFNENQTLAMAGGEVLQAQTLETIQDMRHISKLSAKRLMKALVDPGLAGQLLIAIAQERQLYPHSESAADAPLKVLVTNLDKLTQVFFQYLDVLRSNLSTKDFDAAIPDVVSLMKEFGIDANMAFAVSRQSISQAVTEIDVAAAEEEKKLKEEQSKAKKEATTNGDVNMSDVPEDGQETSADANDAAKQDDSSVKEEIKEEKEEGAISAPTPAGSTPSSPTASSDEPWHPIIKDLMDRLRTALPDDFERKMSLSFYATFWQLSLNDMHVPTAGYEVEIKRQQDKIATIIADRSDVSVAGIKKKDAKKKELNDLQDRLRAEMKIQVQTYQMVRNRLQKEKSHWFTTHPLAMTPALHDNIIQECFLPRLLLSPFDAQYTYKMLFFLHSAGTPGFRTMFLIDRILREKQLTSLIFICTAREADNLGRFLNELLKELRRWHADSAIYEKHAYGAKKDLPGFARRFNEEKQPETFLGYEDFRRLLYKWHASLNGALKACFTGGEYMHIRNAIVILKAVHQHFPVINWMGKAQLDCVLELSRTETREDLKLAATSLIGDLKKRESQWMLPQAFRLADPNSTQKPSSRAATEGASTPQPGQATKLNASATEFKPSQHPNGIATNGTGKDAEDGEIDDAKGKTDQMTVSIAAGEKDKSSQFRKLESDRTESKPGTPGPGASQLPSRGPHTDSKPSTPGPSGQGTPSRPEPSRNQSGPSVGGRLPHALPNRPEPQPPRSRMPDRQGERPPRHDGRGPPNHDYGRLERPGDMPREFPDRTRDGSSSRRPRSRSPGPAHMDRERREPQWQGGREAWDDERVRPPPRDVRQGGRAPPQWNEPPRGRPFDSPGESPRGRPPFDQQGQPSDGRNWQPGSMPPPSSTGPYQHPDRPGRFGERGGQGQLPDRPSTSGADRGGMNPERAALLEGDIGRRPENFRSERDPSRRDRGSRPHSPRRGDERPPAFPPRDDYRDERGPPSQERLPPTYPSSRDRREDPNSIPPTGPRSDRPARGDYPAPPSARGGRELFEPSAPRPLPADPNHGRLNQEFLSSRSSDPSYGRLNAPEPPSGPRGRGGAGRGRNQSGSVPQSPISERGPPSGPNAERREHRESAAFDHGPPTPSSEHGPADVSGIHPDRLRQIPGAREMPAPSSSSFPPSGPRSSHRQSASGPSVTSPTGRNPPTGPASTSERRQEDKRFAGINNMLQQSGTGSYGRDNDRGASIRGRAGRPSSTNSPATSQPSTPIPSHLDAPRGDSGRPDLMAGRPGGPDSGAQDERDHRGSRRERRGEGERRSGRHRSTSPRDRERDGSRRTEERPPRNSAGGADDSRDKRGGPGVDAPPRERRSGRTGEEGGRSERESSHRERRGPRDSGPGPGWPEEVPPPPPPPPRRGGGSQMDDQSGGYMGGGGHGSHHGGPPNGEGGGRPLRNGPSERESRSGGGPRESREGREPREPRGDRDRKRGRGGDVDGGAHGDSSKRPRRGRGGEEGGRSERDGGRGGV